MRLISECVLCRVGRLHRHRLCSEHCGVQDAHRRRHAAAVYVQAQRGQENQLRPFDTRKLYISYAVYLIGYPIMQCIQFNASLLPTATNSMRRTIGSGMVRPVVFGCYRRSLRKRSGRPASCRRRAPARPCPRWRSWPGGSATARAGASAQTPPSRRVSGPAGRMPDRQACSRP